MKYKKRPVFALKKLKAPSCVSIAPQPNPIFPCMNCAAKAGKNAGKKMVHKKGVLSESFFLNTKHCEEGWEVGAEMIVWMFERKVW